MYKIEFPAVRGTQAGRTFYTANVPWCVLGRLLQLDTAGDVLERSQREVNEPRAIKVKDYILNNKETFIIPSLTGVINADELDFIIPAEAAQKEAFQSIGILSVGMDAVIKLFDGQHRATGILKAISDEKSFQQQQVPIMLFANMTLKERQQAFSDINGTATKPQQSLSDSYNLRDGLPLLAKYISLNCNCFDGLIEFERNTITAKSDKLFPLKTIKDASQKLLGLSKGDLIEEHHNKMALDFWNSIGRVLRWSLSDIISDDLTVQDIRQETIKTHTIMINAIALAGNHFIKEKYIGNLDFESLKKLNFKRDSLDFVDRCVSSKSSKMLTDATALKLTANKIICILGGKLNEEQMFIEDLNFDGNQCYLDNELSNPIKSAIQGIFPEKKPEKIIEIANLVSLTFESQNVILYKNYEMTVVNDLVLNFINNEMKNNIKVMMWTNNKFVTSEVSKYLDLLEKQSTDEDQLIITEL